MDFNTHNDTSTKSTITAPSITISYDDSILLYNTSPELLELHKTLVTLENTDPLQGIEAAINAVKKYEDEPLLAYRLETIAHRSGNRALSQQIKEDNYRKFPLSLLIRCRYAFGRLEMGKLTEAASAISYTFNLQTLYPERSTFHFLEIGVFYGLLVRYFCELKDFNRAVTYFAELAAIDKDLANESELRDAILSEVIEQSLSPENIHLLFRAGKDDKQEESNA